MSLFNENELLFPNEIYLYIMFNNIIRTLKEKKHRRENKRSFLIQNSIQEQVMWWKHFVSIFLKSLSELTYKVSLLWMLP
jgi:hypothetical protein